MRSLTCWNTTWIEVIIIKASGRTPKDSLVVNPALNSKSNSIESDGVRMEQDNPTISKKERVQAVFHKLECRFFVFNF